MNKKNLIVMVCSVLFLILVGIIVLVWVKPFSKVNQKTIYLQLQSNSDFIKAQGAFHEGRWAEAIDLYKLALSSTSDENEKLSIYYYLAAAENLSGQNIEAIPHLKQVVAAESLPNETRAYAAQYLGIMTTNLSDLAVHNSIMAEMFKDSPYKEMYVSNDDSLSSRHLFEYASSLYPLGISEANIAYWYVGNIISNKVSTTTEPGISQIKLVQLKLKSADADIDRTSNSLTNSNLIPQIYARKAEVTDGLALLGISPKEQAQQAYADALKSYSTYLTLPEDDWFLRFRYASFLSREYGTGRQSEIHTIIAPLYANPAYTALTKPFFTTLGGVQLTQTPTAPLETNALRARRVAGIDSDFKNFLISVGWSKNKF